MLGIILGAKTAQASVEEACSVEEVCIDNKSTRTLHIEYFLHSILLQKDDKHPFVQAMVSPGKCSVKTWYYAEQWGCGDPHPQLYLQVFVHSPGLPGIVHTLDRKPTNEITMAADVETIKKRLKNQKLVIDEPVAGQVVLRWASIRDN